MTSTAEKLEKKILEKQYQLTDVPLVLLVLFVGLHLACCEVLRVVSFDLSSQEPDRFSPALPYGSRDVHDMFHYVLHVFLLRLPHQSGCQSTSCGIVLIPSDLHRAQLLCNQPTNLRRQISRHGLHPEVNLQLFDDSCTCPVLAVSVSESLHSKLAHHGSVHGAPRSQPLWNLLSMSFQP